MALAIAAVGELDFGMIVLSFPRERNMKHTQHDEHLRCGTCHGTRHDTQETACPTASAAAVLPSAVPAGSAPGLTRL